MSQLDAPADPHMLDKSERRKGKALVICGIILQHFVVAEVEEGGVLD